MDCRYGDSPEGRRLEAAEMAVPLRDMRRLQRDLRRFIGVVDGIEPMTGGDIHGMSGSLGETMRDVYSAEANLEGWITLRLNARKKPKRVAPLGQRRENEPIP